MQESKANAFLVSEKGLTTPNKLNVNEAYEAGIIQNLKRCLENKACEAIILAIESIEILSTGLPIDRIDSLENCSRSLINKTAPETQANGS